MKDIGEQAQDALSTPMVKDAKIHEQSAPPPPPPLPKEVASPSPFQKYLGREHLVEGAALGSSPLPKEVTSSSPFQKYLGRIHLVEGAGLGSSPLPKEVISSSPFQKYLALFLHRPERSTPPPKYLTSDVFRLLPPHPKNNVETDCASVDPQQKNLPSGAGLRFNIVVWGVRGETHAV